MSERSALTDLIRRGQRRQLRHLLVREASLSAVIALGGALLLLVTGTQILNWYWPVVLFAASLALGVYRARTRILSAYQVAQSIDGRLQLHDTLSTAYFFSQHPDRSDAPREWIALQRSSAEDLARSADVRHGLPFLAPRTFYINACLVLAVAAMFGIRYGINRSLDLRPPLVRIAFDGFLGSSKEIAEAKHPKEKRPFDEDGKRDQGKAVDPWETKAADLDPAPDTALQTIDTPDANNPDAANAKAKATGQEPQPPNDDSLDSGDKGQNSQGANDAMKDSNASPDGGSQAGKQSASQNDSKQSANSGENSSLTDKMRDALANLMAKLKMQPKSGEGKQSGSSKQNGASKQNSQSAQQQSQSQDPNGSSSSQEQADSNASSQQGQQQSQNGAQQAAQGKSDSKNGDKPNSPDGKSGIGKQDGDKTAREAEQLAAMGKISEIIGKRAANVTGEVMVEVASGKQQLKTQYSDRRAAHAEAGGEINRDEVPLAYQQYVQQYFEEIRKLPKAKPKTSGN